jgi:hypothetical protein
MHRRIKQLRNTRHFLHGKAIQFEHARPLPGVVNHDTLGKFTEGIFIGMQFCPQRTFRHDPSVRCLRHSLPAHALSLPTRYGRSVQYRVQCDRMAAKSITRDSIHAGL